MLDLKSIIEKMECEIDTDDSIDIMNDCMQEIEESGILSLILVCPVRSYILSKHFIRRDMNNY